MQWESRCATSSAHPPSQPHRRSKRVRRFNSLTQSRRLFWLISLVGRAEVQWRHECACVGIAGRGDVARVPVKRRSASAYTATAGCSGEAPRGAETATTATAAADERLHWQHSTSTSTSTSAQDSGSGDETQTHPPAAPPAQPPAGQQPLRQSSTVHGGCSSQRSGGAIVQ
jgi:hypothetical protein